ncbi:MAG: hypothetical protein HOP29_07390 [Phycisphaerales bacterium]|nr:hypothetical protein [Phycisphaerales bacterium]
MYANYRRHPLHRLFAGLTEDAFYAQVGVCDPRVVEYLVVLLLEFVHVDRLYKLRDPRGRRIESLTEMLSVDRRDLQERSGLTEGELHRYLGDFSLFWSGVFPEGMRYQPGGVHPDRLLDVVDRGKESYAIASRFHDEDSDPPGSLFKRLSAEFELCVHGLGLVRQGWERRERRDGGTPGERGELLY